MKLFKFIYFLFLAVFYFLALPILLLLLFKKKYQASIPARFFYLQPEPLSDREIWLHACSFGEVKSLTPIIEKMLKNDKKILLTTTTQTGHTLAQEFVKKGDCQVLYLPFELYLPLWKKRLKKLERLIVVESELWFMLFEVAKSLGARTFLINARIADWSFEKYLRLKFYYSRIFALIDRVFAQANADALRLEALGAKGVEVFGNLKIYTKIKATKRYEKPQKTLIVAGSTHPMEEKIVLRAFLEFKKQNPDSLLVLAPRHPERFDEIYHSLSGHKVGRISIDGINEEQDILLLDVLGELNNIYRIADVVILCGSFIKAGGHNPLEPASFGVKLLSGPYIFNQYALFDCIEGYTFVQDGKDLCQKLLDYENLPKSKIKAQRTNLDGLVAELLDG